MDRLHDRRELARVALLELAGGPRRLVAELAELLDIEPAEFAAYWDGHTAIPADVARRLVTKIEERTESLRSLAAMLRFHLDGTEES